MADYNSRTVQSSAYNRNNNRFNRGGNDRGFKRGGFNDRGPRGPVEMFQAVCDNCGKQCEVPFRPTNGKPVYCSDCFEKNRGSENRGQESRDYTPRREQPTNNNGGNSKQLEEINNKLDKILEILEAAAEEAGYEDDEEDEEQEELDSEETQVEETPKEKKSSKKTKTQVVENI